MVFDASTRRSEALAVFRKALDRAGVETPALDARVLVMEALGCDATDLALRPEAVLGDAGAERLRRFLARRLAGEPVGRILGEREFWGLAFELSPDTLEPRPDTETVVAAALEALSATAEARILDFGVGSGCILVALLHERPRAWGLGIDRSAGALTVAARNARRHGVRPRAAFAASDWAAAVAGRFDLIVSNPPYIPSADISRLAPEVRDHDPRLALDGGPDGLDAFRAILADARRLLAPAGRLVVEVGDGQAEAVARLARGQGLAVTGVSADLAGRPRAVALSAG